MRADRPADAPIVFNHRHPAPFVKGGTRVRNAQCHPIPHLRPDAFGVKHPVRVLVTQGLDFPRFGRGLYRIGTTMESAATKNLIAQGFAVTSPQQAMGPGLDLGLHDQMNLKKFMAKRFDLLVSLDWAAAFNAKNDGIAPDELQPALVLDESMAYWYGVNLQTDPEVVRKLNAALQRIKNDGRYQQLRLKYLPKSGK